MKNGVRLLGVDDASFELSQDSTQIVGIVHRGTEFIEDVQLGKVKVDGDDATEAVVGLFDSCKNPSQIRAILVDGIAFAGFNVVDIEEVAERTGKPVVAATPNSPDREDFRATMRRTGNSSEAFEKLDQPDSLEVEQGSVYYQYSGCNGERAEELLRTSLLQGLTPEPIRVAHIFGKTLGDPD